MRKRLLGKDESLHPAAGRNGRDIAEIATVWVTSEDAGHPIDNAFDGRGGRGGTRWVAAGEGPQSVVLAFDSAEELRCVRLEIEEPEVERTQEVALAVSHDGGKTYREVVRQEYNFSPGGATFEREEWAVPEKGVTHLRLDVKPDKGGRSCRASLTSLDLV